MILASKWCAIVIALFPFQSNGPRPLPRTPHPEGRGPLHPVNPFLAFIASGSEGSIQAALSATISTRRPRLSKSRLLNAAYLDHIADLQPSTDSQDQDRCLPRGVLRIAGASRGNLFLAAEQDDHTGPRAIVRDDLWSTQSRKVVFSSEDPPRPATKVEGSPLCLPPRRQNDRKAYPGPTEAGRDRGISRNGMGKWGATPLDGVTALGLELFPTSAKKGPAPPLTPRVRDVEKD